MKFNIRNFVVLMWVFACFTNTIYAETDFQKIYGLNDREKLSRIVNETENGNLPDKEKLKILGVCYHNLAVLEIRGASKKAYNYLEKLLELSPGDYEVLAYLGSAKTMIARDSWNVLTKVSSVNGGANMMDKAVTKGPDNIAVRIVRAVNSLSLPKFFNRKHLAKTDLLHVEDLMKKPEINVDSDVQSEVFYQLGIFYKSEGDKSLAEEYFKKSITVSPNSYWGIESKKEL